MSVPAPPTVQPLVVQGHLLVALQSGVLSSRRIADGSEVWTARLAVDQPMAADDARVYAVAGSTLYALRLSDGMEIWRAEAGKVAARPVVTADWVVIAAGNKLSVIQAADGRTVWARDIGAVEQAPAADAQTLYVPLVDGRLIALDFKSGSQRWERTLGADPSEPLASGDRVFVGAEKAFYSLKTETGDVDWQWRVGAHVLGKPVADTSHVYYVAMDNVLRAHDRRNGALRWKQGLAFRPTSGAALVGGYLSVPSPTPELRAFNPANGKPAGTLTLGDPIETVPAFVENAPPAEAVIVAVTGNLQKQWKLWLAVPGSPALPDALPLKALPGLTKAPGT